MAEAGKPSRVQGLSSEEIAAGKRNPLPEPSPEPVTPERAYRMGTEAERDRNRAESSARGDSGRSGGGSRSTVKTVTVSDNQAAITAAFAVIGVIILAKHQWIQKIATWASSAPKAVSTAASAAPAAAPSQAQQQVSQFGITLPPQGASTTIQGAP